MLTKDETKKLAAEYAIRYVEQGMTVGIGTGSTVYWFIQELARRVKQGLVCQCVPTSTETDALAKQLGITMRVLNDVDKIDITIDGADEINPALTVIKGGGGALLQEKMVAAASDRLIIIADNSKLVKKLGRFPLPVEVIPYGWKQVQQHLQLQHHITATLRLKNDLPFITDHGHYILDGAYQHIEEPEKLSVKLNGIPGVVDNGLFIGLAKEAVVGSDDGNIHVLYPSE